MSVPRAAPSRTGLAAVAALGAALATAAACGPPPAPRDDASAPATSTASTETETVAPEVAKPTLPQPTRVAGIRNVRDIVFTERGLFAADPAAATIWRIATPTGATPSKPTAFAKKQVDVGELEADEHHLFWSTKTKVFRAALTGGAPFPLTPDLPEPATQIGGDVKYLYFAQGFEALYQVDKLAGGKPGKVDLAGQWFAADRRGVYSLDLDKSDQAWFVKVMDGGGLRASHYVMKASEEFGNAGLFADDTHLYCVGGFVTPSGASFDGLLRIAKRGGAVTSVTRRPVRAVALDGEEIFYIGDDGGLRAQLKESGVARMLATNQETGDVPALAVGGGRVFWTTPEGIWSVRR